MIREFFDSIRLGRYIPLRYIGLLWLVLILAALVLAAGAPGCPGTLGGSC